MKSKIINREVKILTIIDYIDGGKKTTTDYKAYFDNIEIPALVYKKIEYRDPNGKIDEDKSIFLRGTPYGFNNDKTSQEEHTVTESNSDSDSDSDTSDSESDTSDSESSHC